MRKLDIAQMHEIASSRGGKCLSSVYVNSQVKRLWECEKKHQWRASPASVKSGSWCRRCGQKKAGERLRLTIDDMHHLAEKRGGKCLSAEYIRAQSKLFWECSDEHQFEQTPAEVRRGNWCPICRKVQRGLKSIYLLGVDDFL